MCIIPNSVAVVSLFAALALVGGIPSSPFSQLGYYCCITKCTTKKDLGGELSKIPETMLDSEFKSWKVFLLFGEDSASPKSRAQNQVHHSTQTSSSVAERRHRLIPPQWSTDAKETSCLVLQV